MTHENLNVINAILYVAENGCKWRALPKRFRELACDLHTHEPPGRDRCARSDFFSELQRERLIRIKIEAVSLDSAIVKVHPDAPVL